MKKVLCLYRVSTLSQVDPKDDIPMQRRECEAFIEQQEDWVFYGERLEKGVSGYKVSANKRDVILEIRAMAERKEFDVLLVFMFDRLGRREDETPFLVQWFIEHGIEVWSTREGQQRLDSQVDKLLNFIRFWQASGESAKTSVRVKAAHTQMTQDGIWRGGKCPYGYKLVRNGRTGKKNRELYDLEIDPVAGSQVQLIFEMAGRQGMGTTRIANTLCTSSFYQPVNGCDKIENIHRQLEPGQRLAELCGDFCGQRAGKGEDQQRRDDGAGQREHRAQRQRGGDGQCSGITQHHQKRRAGRQSVGHTHRERRDDLQLAAAMSAACAALPIMEPTNQQPDRGAQHDGIDSLAERNAHQCAVSKNERLTDQRASEAYQQHGGELAQIEGQHLSKGEAHAASLGEHVGAQKSRGGRATPRAAAQAHRGRACYGFREHAYLPLSLAINAAPMAPLNCG